MVRIKSFWDSLQHNDTYFFVARVCTPLSKLVTPAFISFEGYHPEMHDEVIKEMNLMIFSPAQVLQ